MSSIVAAILFLAPQLTPAEAGFYARLVDYEASQAGIHPFLVVAIVQQESGWNRRAKGPTADHGLCQVHVSKTTNPELLGHEHLLYDPMLNLHYCTRMMVFWRAWHHGRCYPSHSHPWWSHLKWGRKIKDNGASARKRVGALYADLLGRFGPGV
jgi:hypothetical protein